MVEDQSATPPVVLIELPRNKKQQMEEPVRIAPPALVRMEWGSKQPKQVDKDILRYALTTGGELAQKQQNVEMEEEIEAIRANLFVEITEGEASLACDKRGSRVLQNLVKHAKQEQAIEGVAERLKPYIGHLSYEPFASHVIQTLIESPHCPSQWKLDLCAQISKVDEWWALMHHPSGTHVGRSLVRFLKSTNNDAKRAIEDLMDSLMRGSQQDWSNACKNQAAGPFLALVVSEILSTEQKQVFAAKLLEDEQGQVNGKEVEQLIMHPVSSRVMETLTGADCNALWKPWAMDNLQRLVFHSIANFVAQRLVENERDEEVLAKICQSCPVQALLERDRVGVLNAILRSVCGFAALEQKMQQDLLQVEIVDHAVSITRHVPKRHLQEDTATKMHAGLLETMYILFAQFSLEMRKPFASKVLAMDSKQLVGIAKDSLAGKKVLEPLLERQDDNVAFDLAKRFKTHFESLVLDKHAVFVAKKSFAVLKRADRVKIMEEEIVPNELKLNGAGPWGRQFLLAVKTNEFKANAKEWARKMEEEAQKSNEPAAAPAKKQSLKEKWKQELNL